MKIHALVFLVLALFMLADLVYSFVRPETSNTLLFWEVDIWIYRVYKAVLFILFIKFYLDKRKARNA